MALICAVPATKAENHIFAAVYNGYKCQTCNAFMLDADVAANNSTTAAATTGGAPEWLNRVYKTAGGSTIW